MDKGLYIYIRSSDGKSFKVNRENLRFSSVMQELANKGAKNVKRIELPYRSSILEKVLEWARYHNFVNPNIAASAMEARAWDANFVKSINEDVINMISVTKELKMEELTDLVGERFCDIVREKSVKQLREMFNIQNDMTPEEIADCKREVAWCSGVYDDDDDDE